MLQIGDKLYCYADRYTARKLSNIKEVTVVSVGRKYAKLDNKEMVNLETLRSKEDNYGSYQFYRSLEDMKKEQWVSGNAWKIASAVQGMRDYDKLKQIAELIGYKEDSSKA